LFIVVFDWCELLRTVVVQEACYVPERSGQRRTQDEYGVVVLFKEEAPPRGWLSVTITVPGVL
jgi:hypothetical protein